MKIIALATAAAIAAFAPTSSNAIQGGSKGVLEWSGVTMEQVVANEFIVTHSASVTKNGITTNLELSKIGMVGDEINGVIFGELLDQNENSIPSADSGITVSPNPDFTSVLHDPVTGKTYTLTHIEYFQPAALYLTELNHDTENCSLEPVSYTYVNNPEEGGIWIPCSGSVTPWNTHMGSEEYEPDARLFEETLSNTADTDANGVPDGVDALNNDRGLHPRLLKGFMSYFDIGVNMRTQDPADYVAPVTTIAQYKDNFFPYKYGHAWEFTITDFETGEYTLKKHYGMGRISFELCQMAPDKKTAYCTDDGTNVGFFRFVADKAGDLNAGTLSCAAFRQEPNTAAKGGDFSVNWIELGYTADAVAELKALVMDKDPTDDVEIDPLVFSDIFETAPAGSGSCPDGFTIVQVTNNTVECLKVKEGKTKWAAFFETRRYCAMVGGTAEFSKWEGLTFDEDSATFYTAISSLQKGMSDTDTSFNKAQDNIKVKENTCGCIYEMLTFSSPDTEYDINEMKVTLCGEPIEKDERGNQCALDGIANPDNCVIVQGYNELFIAEDSGRHMNNILWSMNLSSKKLTAVASVPRGAETTGAMAVVFPDAPQCDYYLMVSQHPSNTDISSAAVHVMSAKAQTRADAPTGSPSASPTFGPSTSPSTPPIAGPTMSPSSSPTSDPTMSPTMSPSTSPTFDPTMGPVVSPTSGGSSTLGAGYKALIGGVTVLAVAGCWRLYCFYGQQGRD